MAMDTSKWGGCTHTNVVQGRIAERVDSIEQWPDGYYVDEVASDDLCKTAVAVVVGRYAWKCGLECS